MVRIIWSKMEFIGRKNDGLGEFSIQLGKTLSRRILAVQVNLSPTGKSFPHRRIQAEAHDGDRKTAASSATRTSSPRSKSMPFGARRAGRRGYAMGHAHGDLALDSGPETNRRNKQSGTLHWIVEIGKEVLGYNPAHKAKVRTKR